RRQLPVREGNSRSHLRGGMDLARALARDVSQGPALSGRDDDAPPVEGEVGESRGGARDLRARIERGPARGTHRLLQPRRRRKKESSGRALRSRRQPFLLSSRSGRDDAAPARAKAAVDRLRSLPRYRRQVTFSVGGRCATGAENFLNRN